MAKRTETLVFGPIGHLEVNKKFGGWYEVSTLEGDVVHVTRSKAEAVAYAIKTAQPVAREGEDFAALSKAELLDRLRIIQNLALAAEMKTSYDGSGNKEGDLDETCEARTSRPELYALYRAARGLKSVE